ncbi:hypothetical protein [Nocardiopsis suaedae]|uniref:Transmembrane protein n=1 Tax=Nocardiopsis suaedae TaxID=3018444 RepID=A0ABT4TV22_9ACTN|nr:hypothetical protein [Nocardiopsis suaedae]MDA2808553.1 hypothetical protein [Nocardiopsis suaedae]
MDLVKPWVIGLIVYVVTTVLGIRIMLEYATLDQMEDLWTAVTWQASVSFVVYFLTAMMAAIVHRPSKGRRSTGRSALACMAVPVAGTLIYLIDGSVVSGTARGAALSGLLSWNAAALAGAILGWQLVRTMRP